GVRTSLDDRLGTSFGRRSVEWELKGVPLRVEVGPRELADGVVTLVQRLSGTKSPVAIDQVVERVRRCLGEAQARLLAEATAFRQARTTEVATMDDAVEVATDGFARIPWSTLGTSGEAALADRGLSVRCLQRPDGGLPSAEQESDAVAVVARAY
ncbi:MAG: proline--tRNA ligase, partial [Actinobacteria bacterium]|nr:proline--tRNA ligase [Actinomycetota bacterium]